MSNFGEPVKMQAIIQKPVKYVENVWGPALRTQHQNLELEQQFWPVFGTDRMNTGSLPYAAGPRYSRRMVNPVEAQSTRLHFDRPCWNECVNQAGPWYLRHWQIWDNVPFKPSMGDVTKDPRYGIDTKIFKEDVKITRPGLRK